VARIPLFPLGSVLFPGLALPLHIFEPRYRQLVADLQQGDDDASRSFGVVAIRAGHEVGATSVASLHEVGTCAVLRRVTPYPDGRFDILATGARRFRLLALDESRPYLQGDVEWLDDDAGEPEQTAALAADVAAGFRLYQQVLGAAPEETGELPDDPTVLSYLVSAAMVLDLGDRQRLLATPSTAQRLQRLSRVLDRERTIIRLIEAVPATDLLRAPLAPN
jgi:Lon protease-like protein